MPHHCPLRASITFVSLFITLGCVTLPAINDLLTDEATPSSEVFESQSLATSTPTRPTDASFAGSFRLISSWFGKAVQSPGVMIRFPKDEVAAQKTREALEDLNAINYPYAILVENPHPESSIQSASFWVKAYDSLGKFLGEAGVTDYSVWSGDKIVISGENTILIPKETTISEMKYSDIQVIYREEEPSGSSGTNTDFSVDQVAFWPCSNEKVQAAALIQSHAQAPIIFPTFTAIAYDANGNIVGTGETTNGSYYMVPGQTYPVAIPVNITGSVVSVDFYPTLRDDSIQPGKPVKFSFPTVEDLGFSMHHGGAWYAAIVQNGNLLESTRKVGYLLVFYGADGVVASVVESWREFNFAEETWIIEGWAAIPCTPEIVSMSVLFVDSGEADPLPVDLAANPLSAQDAAFSLDSSGKGWDRVQVSVTNALNEAVLAEIAVVAYDANGRIIGGHQPLSDGLVTVPANGTISLDYESTLLDGTVKIVVYPMPWRWVSEE
jgi:hypothetical protein